MVAIPVNFGPLAKVHTAMGVRRTNTPDQAPGQVRAEFDSAPLRDRRPAADPQRPGSGQAGTALVVIEEDSDEFLLLKRALVKAEVTAPLHWARSGTEALAIIAWLQSGGRDICLVLETKLRDMSGFDLIETLQRQDPHDRRIRFVLLTGFLQPSTRHRAQKLGVDAFFIKPTSSSELVEVARALKTLLACHQWGPVSG